MFNIQFLSMFELCYFMAFSLLIGLCIGSFTNVVILRGLSGESIAFPGSKCPKCNKPLKWYVNIPVISYLILQGKCRYCKEPISIQYPIVELLTGILYLFTFLHFGLTLSTLFTWAMLTLFIAIAVTDLKEQVVLVPHTIILAFLGLIYNFTNKEFLLPILGIIVGFLTIEIVARLGEVIFKKRAFGEGDSYIGAAIGAILGWKLFLSSLFLAIIIQTIIIFPAFLYKLIKEKDFKLLTSILLFITTAVCLLTIGKYNFILYIALTLLLAIFGIFTIIELFKETRNKDIQTIPFGPAMLVGAFLIIFFADYLNFFIF